MPGLAPARMVFLLIGLFAAGIQPAFASGPSRSVDINPREPRRAPEPDTRGLKPTLPRDRCFIGVMGAIARAGVYEFSSPGPSLRGLIERAGGFAPLANGQIRLIRRGHDGRNLLYSRYADLRLLPGDVVVAIESPALSRRRTMDEREPVGRFSGTPVELAFVNLIDRPVVVTVRSDDASVARIVKLLGLPPGAVRKVRIIPPADDGNAPAAAAEPTEKLASGCVLVFDPAEIDAARIPPLPEPIRDSRAGTRLAGRSSRSIKTRLVNHNQTDPVASGSTRGAVLTGSIDDPHADPARDERVELIHETPFKPSYEHPDLIPPLPRPRLGDTGTRRPADRRTGREESRVAEQESEVRGQGAGDRGSRIEDRDHDRSSTQSSIVNRQSTNRTPLTTHQTDPSSAEPLPGSRQTTRIVLLAGVLLGLLAAFYVLLLLARRTTPVADAGHRTAGGRVRSDAGRVGRSQPLRADQSGQDKSPQAGHSAWATHWLDELIAGRVRLRVEPLTLPPLLAFHGHAAGPLRIRLDADHGTRRPHFQRRKPHPAQKTTRRIDETHIYDSTVPAMAGRHWQPFVATVGCGQPAVGPACRAEPDRGRNAARRYEVQSGRLDLQAAEGA